MSGDPATRDSSQKWLKFKVYSPLIWGAKGEIFIPGNKARRPQGKGKVQKLVQNSIFLPV